MSNIEPEGSNEQSTNNVWIKKRMLREINDLIAKQEAQLAFLYTRKGRLEDEIAKADVDTTSIESLPLKLVVKIFENVIPLNPNISYDLEDANSDRNNLMLVCKSWHEAIVGTPSLWTTIYVIAPDFDNDPFRWIHSVNLYLDRCLRWSGQAMLDIVLDLELAGIGRAYAHNQAYDSLKLLPDTASLHAWLQEIEWEACPTAKAYDQAFRQLLCRLLVRNSPFFERLNGISLDLPFIGRWCRWFWRLFNEPNPESVELPLPDITISSSALSPHSLIRNVTNMTKHLSIHKEYLNDMPHFPHLWQLIIWVFLREDEWDMLATLGQLPSLRELSLVVISPYVDHEDQSNPFVDPIKLTGLRHLHLEGRVPFTVIQAFELQSLEKLTIEDRVVQMDPFPQAQIFTIVQSVGFEYLFERDLPTMDQLLLSVFSQLSAAHTVEIPDDLGVNAITLIEGLESQKKLRSLRSVVAVSEDGERTVLLKKSRDDSDSDSD